MKKAMRSLLLWLVYYFLVMEGTRLTKTAGFLGGLFDGMISLFAAGGRLMGGTKPMFAMNGTKFYDSGFLIGCFILFVFTTSRLRSDDEEDGGEGGNEGPLPPDSPSGKSLKKPRRRKKRIQIGGRLRGLDFDLDNSQN